MSPAYDEIVHEVSTRINQSGDLGKADIGALLLWKRLRADTPWVQRLHATPELKVRQITSCAIAAVRRDDSSLAEAAAQGRAALRSLPGFTNGDALASAVLYAAAPDRMAVYDRRVQNGIERLGLTLKVSHARYGNYVELITDLLRGRPAEARNWRPRQVDLAYAWRSFG